MSEEVTDLAARRQAKAETEVPEPGELVMTVYEDGSIEFPNDQALMDYFAEIYDDLLEALTTAVKEEDEMGESIGIVSAAVREWLTQTVKQP